jgi:ABC-2 type transport system permease protein
MNLLRLLKLEWSKFSPSGTFRVFAGLYLGSFALVVFLARSVGNNMTMTANGTLTHPMAGLMNYPNNWQLLACIGSWMNLFVLGSLGVFMITMEFGNRTLRQSVIFGMSRLEVAVSKLIWAAALAFAATLFYLLLAFGGEIVDGGGLGLPPAGCVIGFFVQALGYLFLGNLVGLLIRQTALATLGYLAYVVFLETACKWIFYFSVAKTRLLMFLPDQVLGALTPLPVPAAVNHLVNSNPATTPLTTTEAVLSALTYLTLFGTIFCRRIVKCDL